jgi:peptidoglycan/LPS O-acetylase OafA/YrhL
MSRKNYLDVVRAFAALLVVTVHTQQHFPAPNRAIELMASFGQLGVQLFFTLSAFLIFESLDRIRQKGGTLTEFFVHRFLRIAPLYYFAMVLFLTVFGIIFPAVGLMPHAPASYTVEAIIANVFFVHGLVPSATNAIVGGGWSIGTEMLFYLLAPALFALRNRPARLIAIGAACFPLIWLATQTFQPLLDAPNYVNINGFLFFSILNELPVFLCGALLFALKEQAFSISREAAIMGWVAPMALACWLWVTHFTSTMTFAYVPLLAGISSSFFIVLMSKVAISNRFVIEFGRRAFSIYIFNMVVLMLVENVAVRNGIHLPYLGALPIVVVLVYLFSGTTYNYIEKPFLRMAKRFSETTSAVTARG